MRSVAASLLFVVVLALPSWGAEGAPAATRKVREAAVAGKWYPAERSLVAAEVRQMLSNASAAPVLGVRPVALVVPHAGWRFSGNVAAAAFRNLHHGDFARVVVVGPSHHAPFTGFSVTDADAYRTPLGEIPVCREAASALVDGKVARTIAGAEEPEHDIEIELPFLQTTLGSFCLVPVLAGDASAEQERDFAAKLATLDDGKTLFVFSTDFTHYGQGYGYTPFGPSGRAARDKVRAQNEEAVGLLLKKDASGFRAFLDRTKDSICGRHGLGVLLDLLPRIAPKAQASLLGRYASIDIPGFDGDDSVTYVALAYAAKPASGAPMERPPANETCPADAPPLDPALGEALLATARATLDTELKGTEAVERALAALPAGRNEPDRLQGVFVTLNRTDPGEIAREGKLRGCVGQIFPVLPLREAVIYAAVSAALHDGRFEPVRAEELPRLEVEMTLLSPPKAVASWRDIRLGTHGIVIDKAGRRAVFLPQVPGEEGWTLEETLAHLSRKAGLPSDAWKEGATFSVFTGQIFRERREAERPGK